MYKRYGILIISVTILVLCSVGTASATNWSVDGSGGADFIGIPDAINDAKNGDTILVYSGVYYENVVVDKSVTLKGIGHPVVDASGEGDAITLSAEGITLEGFNITNVGSGLGGGVMLGKGIRVISCNNYITGNNVCNNSDGITLYSSCNNTITSNNVSSKYYGIQLYESSKNNAITGNTFVNAGLFVSSSYQNTVEENTVNGKPLVYLEDASDYKVEEAGQVILVNCSNITVENLELSNTSVAVALFNTRNSIISNNTVCKNYNGIFLEYSCNNAITGNTVCNNYRGVHLVFSCNNYITGNTVCENDHESISLSGSDNVIYRNNFINNTDTAHSRSMANIWNSPERITYHYNGTNYRNYLGNYWDDQEEKYPDSEEIDTTGIWDTPYGINSDKDNYPLTIRSENYIILTQKECEVDVNSIRIPNLLLQSSLQPYAILDLEIYNFKNTKMFAYFSVLTIYANDEIIGSKKESEEDFWSVEVNEKREEKIYLDVTGERLAELLKNDECLTVNVSLHIYGYANEKSYTGIERSETDMQFEKMIVPFIYNYSSSQVLNKTENMPEEVLKAAEDILHKRLGFFKVLDYYIMRNNSCIRIYYENESREIINDICRPGKVEFRSKTNPMATIEIGMELSEIHNITEPIFDYNDIINRSVVLCRPEKSPWGVSFTLSREGAENLQDAVKRYEYDPELSEAYKFHILTLIEDKVAYDMSMSRDLFRMLSRDKPVYGLQMSIGPNEAGYKEARNLICYLKTGPLPQGSANYDWYESLLWIKENTPDPCVDYYASFPGDKTYQGSAYSVMSWCDYGNWITCIAHRIPVANNNSQLAATFFITSNESEANAVADALNVRYVVSDFTMADAMMSSYQNLFGEMAFCANDTTGYYTENQSEGVTTFELGEVYFETMVTKLHMFDGTEAEFKGGYLGHISIMLIRPFHTKPLQHYRLVHESSTYMIPHVRLNAKTDDMQTWDCYVGKNYTKAERLAHELRHGFNDPDDPNLVRWTPPFFSPVSRVKVFEYVKGARIKGRATNGSTVMIATNITTNQGRVFMYSQMAISNGTYEFVVPYSTDGPIEGGTNFDVLAAPYVLRAGHIENETIVWDTMKEVEVVEAPYVLRAGHMENERIVWDTMKEVEVVEDEVMEGKTVRVDLV